MFATAREKARATSCLSNEKQIGLAFVQYVQDYDEVFPSGNSLHCSTVTCGFGGITFTTNENGVGWAGTLLPYVKSVNLFICPDDALGQNDVPAWAAANNLSQISYAYNSNLTSLNSSKVTSTPMTVLLFEVAMALGDITEKNALDQQSPAGNFDIATGTGIQGYADNALSQIPAPVGPVGGQCTYYQLQGRHTGGSNFAMADGHVKFLIGNKVSAGSTALSASNDQTFAGATSGCPADQPAQGTPPLAWASGHAAGAQFGGTSAITGGTFAATFSPI